MRNFTGWLTLRNNRVFYSYPEPKFIYTHHSNTVTYTDAINYSTQVWRRRKITPFHNLKFKEISQNKIIEKVHAWSDMKPPNKKDFTHFKNFNNKEIAHSRKISMIYLLRWIKMYYTDWLKYCKPEMSIVNNKKAINIAEGIVSYMNYCNSQINARNKEGTYINNSTKLYTKYEIE